jgi:HSP20 family protein
MAKQENVKQTEHAEKAEAQRAGFQGSTQTTGTQGQDVNVQQGQQGGAVQQRHGQGGLARYSRNPFALMQELSDEMDRLFDSFFHGAPVHRRAQRHGIPSLWVPQVDVTEEGNQFRVCVDLPGISKDNVNIDVQEGALIIQGERREERTEGGEQQQGFHRSERHYGSFYREIPLPDYIDTEKAEARMQEGVLNITFPITEERKRGRRLEIKG